MQNQHETNALPGAWTSEQRDAIYKTIKSIVNKDEFLFIVVNKDGCNMIGHSQDPLGLLDFAKSAIEIGVTTKFSGQD